MAFSLLQLSAIDTTDFWPHLEGCQLLMISAYCLFLALWANYSSLCNIRAGYQKRMDCNITCRIQVGSTKLQPRSSAGVCSQGSRSSHAASASRRMTSPGSTFPPP